MELFEKAKEITQVLEAKGCIIIVQTSDGNKLAQYNLSPEEIRENLCLAIYYNEKLILEKEDI